jgi:RNA 3'-terminal phosphate cyclase
LNLRVCPFDAAKRPGRYDLTDLGAYLGGSVEGVVSHISRSIAEAEAGIVGTQLRDLALERIVREVDAFGPGNYCCVRLRYERATVVFSGIGTYSKSRKSVANEVVHQVRDFVKSGAACEKHLADQLLVPLHLFIGRDKGWYDDYEYWVNNWNLAIQKETSHFTTNQMVIDLFKCQG